MYAILKTGSLNTFFFDSKSGYLLPNVLSFRPPVPTVRLCPLVLKGFNLTSKPRAQHTTSNHAAVT